MAIVTLTKEKNPKLGVSVKNNLMYQDKNEEVKERTPKSALIDVLEEAGKVSKMKQGNVMVSIQADNEYKNYFVNTNDKDNNIKFVNANDKEDIIYLNAIDKNDGSGNYFYALNDNNKNAQDLIKNVNIQEVENTDGTQSKYIKARVNLKNDDLKDVLTTMKDKLGIIGKDDIKIADINNLQNSTSLSSIEIPKNINIEKETPAKAKAKETPKKKPFKKSIKPKEQERDIER